MVASAIASVKDQLKLTHGGEHACPACGRLGMAYLGELTPCPNRYQYRPILLDHISPAAQAAVLRYIQTVHGASWEPDG